MAISSVTFGIVALMLASGFIEWIYFDLRESTIRAHIGHLQIVRPGYLEFGRADPFKYLLPVDETMLNRMRQEPGVTVVAPRLGFSGLVSRGETTISFVGEAISPVLEDQLSSSLIIERGTNLQETDVNGVLFGEGLARNLGLEIGDAVTLLATTADGGINAVEMIVRGIFSTVTKGYDDSALRLNIVTANKLLRVNGAHSWVVLLDETAHTDAAVLSLRQQLSPKDFQVVPWYDLADFYKKTVALFSKQVEIMRLIIGVIIVLSISNAMMIGILERTGEIGTAMAIGVRRRTILAQFVAEGVAMGVLGGVIGIAAAALLAYVISVIGIPMPPPPGMAHGFVGQIKLTLSLTAQAFLLAAVTTLAASVYPAWRASRLSIVDALRKQR